MAVPRPLVAIIRKRKRGQYCLKFHQICPVVSIDSEAEFVQVMAWCWIGNIPITQNQWWPKPLMYMGITRLLCINPDQTIINLSVSEDADLIIFLIRLIQPFLDVPRTSAIMMETSPNNHRLICKFDNLIILWIGIIQPFFIVPRTSAITMETSPNNHRVTLWMWVL